ncbi:hypothetical protein BDR06DRAFT_993954 [Suillus hirtellus]|nr:hypothetical protein BDR06DRAFT_993954 [Suillus hirtellus]
MGRLEHPYEELCVKESKFMFISKGIFATIQMFLRHVLLEVDLAVALAYHPSWRVENANFYLHCKFIENTYTHGSYLLLQDEQLIYRLRSLKHYFFLASSLFLTYLLDLAHGTEKGPAKGGKMPCSVKMYELPPRDEWLPKVINAKPQGVASHNSLILDGNSENLR